jgi:hypothetical protein
MENQGKNQKKIEFYYEVLIYGIVAVFGMLAGVVFAIAIVTLINQ